MRKTAILNFCNNLIDLFLISKRYTIGFKNIKLSNYILLFLSSDQLVEYLRSLKECLMKSSETELYRRCVYLISGTISVEIKAPGTHKRNLF